MEYEEAAATGNENFTRGKIIQILYTRWYFGTYLHIFSSALTKKKTLKTPLAGWYIMIVITMNGWAN